MNKRIKELSDEAGLFWQFSPAYEKCLERFAELVRQDEREACAKLCESLFDAEDNSCNEAEQASDWAYKMICCLGISTSNSDINVVGLHKTVKELYEQGRADEREACAKLCESLEIDGRWFANKIRARGKNEHNTKQNP